MVSHGNFVAYYRVSTARQGKSGLGLEAQRAAVREHLNGGTWQVVAEFTEIESGKNADRPKLAAALKECRLRRAKLIIAKLDRLARNVAFVSNLMESGVEFEAVDFPQANRLTIHIHGCHCRARGQDDLGSYESGSCGSEAAWGEARRLSWLSTYGQGSSRRSGRHT